jgi:hypothetical protein
MIEFPVGEPIKRYGVSYGGETMGSWDTAREALSAYGQDRDKIRPVIDPKRTFGYQFRDGRKTITYMELLTAAEEEAKTKAR